MLRTMTSTAIRRDMTTTATMPAMATGATGLDMGVLQVSAAVAAVGCMLISKPAMVAGDNPFSLEQPFAGVC